MRPAVVVKVHGKSDCCNDFLDTSEDFALQQLVPYSVVDALRPIGYLLQEASSCWGWLMLGFLEALGTGNALLWYGVHLHSEARCTGNALLLYRMGFRGASMGSVFVLGECLR